MDPTHGDFYDLRWRDADASDQVPQDLERWAAIEGFCLEGTLARSPGARPLTILDVGCGVGWIAARLSAYGQVTGVDTSLGAIEVAQGKHPQVSFERRDIVKEPFSHRFDVVVCSEVLEHVPGEHKGAFAQALVSHVRPGGTLIVTTPNRLVWRQYWSEPASATWRQPVEEWLTPSELRQLLTPARCRHLTTFNFRFSRALRYRAFNSPKVRTALRLAGLLNLYHRAFSRSCGLYIAGRFQVDGENPV